MRLFWIPAFAGMTKTGLELLPLGRDELVRAIDWIEKYANRTLDRNDFATHRLPGRKRFRLATALR